MAKTADDFQRALERLLSEGQKLGFVAVEVNAGKLHREVGDYPGDNHRMPVCCAVMRRMMKLSDEVVIQPARGQGPRFTVRYRLPN